MMFVFCVVWVSLNCESTEKDVSEYVDRDLQMLLSPDIIMFLQTPIISSV